MSWQLFLAIAITLPALLVAALLTAAIVYRRYRAFQFHRERYMAGARHIEHSRCRCHFCQLEARTGRQGIRRF